MSDEITLDLLLLKAKQRAYDEGYNEGYINGRFDEKEEENKREETQRKKNKNILLLLEKSKNELISILDGEICDHNVNICWCTTKDLIQDIVDILYKEKENE